MHKKNLYICGDSFCTEDSEYGDSWVSLLKQQCPDLKITNLATVGASNYLIYLQVKHAVDNRCDYLIYQATSSIRQEFAISESISNGRDNINRYLDIQSPGSEPVFCTSWTTSSKYCDGILTSGECNKILDFFTKHIDLTSTIEKNYIFIEYILQYINTNLNQTQWAWSRGGFEHKSFNSPQIFDFSKWEFNECCINLWDHYNSKESRPYFHVTDKITTSKVCSWYIDKLRL